MIILSVVPVWRPQSFNCSTGHDSDPMSICSMATICPSKVSSYTSSFLVLNYIKHIRNVDAKVLAFTIIQQSSGSPSYRNQRRKRNKRNPDKKRRSKTFSVCRWHDTVHKKKKNSIRKLLELISEFSKVAGCKINTWESLAFLYTNNEKSEREIKESITFTIATKIIKYLGINLPKDTKELYTENYKTLMKAIKDDINRCRDIQCSWVGRINLV